MSAKFNPAPFDRYSEGALDAIRADREAAAKLKAGLLGGSFPASDPLSATQPSPSKFDAGESLMSTTGSPSPIEDHIALIRENTPAHRVKRDRPAGMLRKQKGAKR